MLLVLSPHESSNAHKPTPRAVLLSNKTRLGHPNCTAMINVQEILLVYFSSSQSQSVPIPCYLSLDLNQRLWDVAMNLKPFCACSAPSCTTPTELMNQKLPCVRCSENDVLLFFVGNQSPGIRRSEECLSLILDPNGTLRRLT